MLNNTQVKLISLVPKKTKRKQPYVMVFYVRIKYTDQGKSGLHFILNTHTITQHRFKKIEKVDNTFQNTYNMKNYVLYILNSKP